MISSSFVIRQITSFHLRVIDVWEKEQFALYAKPGVSAKIDTADAARKDIPFRFTVHSCLVCAAVLSALQSEWRAIYKMKESFSMRSDFTATAASR